jgi:hypothetical protein
VPADLDDGALAEVRAAFLAEHGLADRAAIRAGLAERDARLAESAHHGELVLWFEADLYDQLQLLQVLDALARLRPRSTPWLICVGELPARPRFAGLGELTPGELAALWPLRRAVDAAQLALAQRAWAAFRAPEPRALAGLLSQDLTALPYLRDAVVRQLEELPGLRDGLGRRERAALTAVRDGARTREEVFRTTQAHEARPFEGDSTLFARLESLARPPRPLIATGRDGLTLTSEGAEVLAGVADAVSLRGIDRWIGGTHLRAGAVWRYDPLGARLVEP